MPFMASDQARAGPTLIAYDSLSATDKATWDAVVSALTDAFADETAKEVFLSDIAAFKRENRTLIEYKKSCYGA